MPPMVIVVCNMPGPKLDFNGAIPADGELLTIDDGTGKAPVTFEFDSDSSVLGGAAPTVVNTMATS